MSNVIAFPKGKRNCPPQTIEEMQDRLEDKKIDYVNDIVDYYGTELLGKISQDGFEISENNFMKDFAFTLETLRSVDEAISFTETDDLPEYEE